MKKMLGLIAILLTAVNVNAVDNSYAEASGSYNVSEYTCNELNIILAQEGYAVFNYQSFFGGSGTHLATSSCPAGHIAAAANVQALDGFCTAGYKCRMKQSCTRAGRRDRKERRAGKKRTRSERRRSRRRRDRRCN